MAAITPEGRAELVALFLTMFGEAPTTLQLSRMVTAREQGASLLQIATAAARELEVDFALVASMDATQFANYLANTLLASDIVASERQWAIDWVISNVQGNKSKLQVIVEAVQGLNATTSPAYASSQAQLDATVAAALNIIDNPVVPGQQLTLTTGADALTSNNAVDTFIATEATLSSADLLNGGAGIDTLRYASSGNAAVNEAGFETSNIEIAQVTADAVGGTLFDTTGMTGLTTLRNSNSSEDITLVGMSSLVGVELVNVGSAGALANDPTPDTTLVFNAATVAGAADAVSVTLNGNLNVDGSGIGDLIAQGIETFNLTTTGSASRINTITSASVGTINVSGDQNLTVTSNLVSAETINASALTGNLSVIADSGAIDVAVTGGSGNDRADFSNGWDLNDTFNGGAGTDTLGLTYGVATAIVSANSGAATAVEVLDVTTVAAANGTVDMDNFAGVTKVILNAGVNAGVSATVGDAVTGLEVELDVDAAATGTLVVDLKTDGAADTLTVTLDEIGAGDTVAALTVDDAETLNISADDDTVDGTGTLTITTLTATDATTLNLSGDSRITITNAADPATAILKTVNASAATDNVSISGTNLASAGATITLGAGNDTFAFATANGQDTITLGAGADTVVYNDVAQSDTEYDTITDFVSGTDKLSFQFANPILNFRGNQVSFGLSQGALTGDATPAAGLDAVFQVDDQILWVDVNDDGNLDNNDFRIKLNGVTSLTTADIGLLAAGNTITLSAAAATVNTTGTPVNADKNTTNFGDTINSTIARLAGTTINGALGTDTLALTDAGAVGAIPATITAVEVLQLATVGATANTGIAFNDAGAFTSVTGSANADTIVSTADMVEGGTIALGDGNDVITALALFETAAGADTSYKFNINMGNGDDTVTNTTALTFTADSVLNGGAGTDTLNLAAGSNIAAGSVTGFETLNTGATATMTAAQYASFTTITNGGTITLTTAGTVTAVAGTLATAAAAATTINVGVAGVTVSGNTGAETINLTAAGTLAGLTFNEAAAGGTDTLNIAYDNAGAIVIPALIENAVIGVTQTNGGLTLGANVVTLDTTAATNAFTLVATNAAMTSLKFGSGNDTITTVTANTAAQVLELGAGNDTISALNVGTGALTVDFGSGNGTITDIAANGTGVLTLKFGTPAAGTTNSLNIAATTADLKAGDILDFAGAVTGVVNGAANGTLGVAGGNGQLFIEVSGANSIVTFDADGSRTFTPGDVQITIIGDNTITGGINADGNFVLA